MSTTEDTRILSLEPTTYAFLKELDNKGGPPIYTLSPADARAVLVGLQRNTTVTKPPVDIEDLMIKGGPTGNIPLRIVRPQGIRKVLPAVLYCHGGGWVLGDHETHDRLIREIATGAEVAVVFIDFTRSPEAHYPVAVEVAYAATKWVAEQGSTVGIDPSRLAVAGDSAGGNIAIVITLLAKARLGPKIELQVLFYPVTDAHLNTPSYQQFATGYWLTRDAMRWFWDSYAPDVTVRDEPTVSPLRASLDQLKGLPRALVITDENDVLRDEGEAYAHKLMAAGVPVVAIRYLGTIHDFLMLNPLATTPATRSAISLANATLRQVFTQQVPQTAQP